MKKNVFFLLCMLFFIGCSKSNDEEKDVDSFKAKISGIEWTPETISGYVITGNIQLNGINGLQSISLTLPSETTPGTYDCRTFGSYLVTYSDGHNDIYFSNSGTLTISLHNTTSKKIEGSFDVSLSDLYNFYTIKSLIGTFAITYN